MKKVICSLLLFRKFNWENMGHLNTHKWNDKTILLGLECCHLNAISIKFPVNYFISVAH